MRKKMSTFSKNAIDAVKGWTPPTFHQGKECFVSFSAFDPSTGKMKRKKIMLGRIKGKTAQRKYAQGIMQRLTEKLLEGWNPWIEQTCPMEYTKFADVCDLYTRYLYKMVSDHDFREDSLASYLSYLKIFKEWAFGKPITYIYQVNSRSVSDFLDYVFVERNNSLRTRNNYLAWLKTFCAWLLQRSYLSSDPTAGLTLVKKNLTKNRDVLSNDALKRLHDYLVLKNPHYLLACYFIHYMFIRPHEMTYIKIGDIHPITQTLMLHGENTKNHVDAVVTIPVKIIHLMLDLKVFDSPSGYYLFGYKFKPGEQRQNEKMFRDYWHSKVRPALKFPSSYKFYSLKDTGITNMLRANHDVLTVRDQARHSSISITDIYTPKDITKANEDLLNWEGPL